MITRSDSQESSSRKQRIRIYYSQLHEADCVNALAAAKLANAEIRPLIGYRSHVTLWEAHLKGHCVRLFRELFGSDGRGQ
jgi:hypothetical protein